MFDHDEGFTFSLASDNEIYDPILQMALKILASQEFMQLLNDDSKCTCISKILMIFTMIHEKTKSGLSIRVDFDANIAKNLVDWFTFLSKKANSTNFIDMLTLIRLLRVLNFKNSEKLLTKISALNAKLAKMLETKNLNVNKTMSLEKFETTLLLQHCYDTNFITDNNIPLESNNIPTFETEKDIVLTLFSESC